MSETPLLDHPSASPFIDLPPAEQLTFRKKDALYEIALYENADGSSDMLLLDKRRAGTAATLELPEPLQPFLFGDPAQKIAYDRIAGDMAEAGSYLDLGDDQQAIIKALGLELTAYEPNKAFVSAHIPSTGRINTFLDFVRDRTGFAMRLEDYLGGEYSQEEQLQHWHDGNIPVSVLPPVRQHDVIFHLPAFTAMPGESFSALTEVGKHDSDVARRIDFAFDPGFFRHATDPSQPHAERYLRHNTYAWTLYDTAKYATLSQEQQLTVDSLAQATHERTAKLIQLAHEFNSTT